MKKLKKNLIIAAFLAVLTLSASLFTVSNFPVQTALAQTTSSTDDGGGPQDGSDGKKKRCRPPQQCPTGNPTGNPNSNRQGGTETTGPNAADGSEATNWWDDFTDWLFGE